MFIFHGMEESRDRIDQLAREKETRGAGGLERNQTGLGWI